MKLFRQPYKFTIGDSARVRVRQPSGRFSGKWGKHFWRTAKIVQLSDCGRYATISGMVSWQFHGPDHEDVIPIAHLRPVKNQIVPAAGELHNFLASEHPTTVAQSDRLAALKHAQTKPNY